MGLYENIKKIAKLRGVPINKIESDLGFPRSSMAKYNVSVPSIDKIAIIAKYLRVSIDTIYYGSEDKDIADNCADLIRQLPPEGQEAILDQIEFQKSKSSRLNA